MVGDPNAGIESMYQAALASVDAGLERLLSRVSAGDFDAQVSWAQPEAPASMSYLDEELPTSPAQPSPYGSSAVRGLGDAEGAAAVGRPLVDFSWEDPEGSANF